MPAGAAIRRIATASRGAVATLSTLLLAVAAPGARAADDEPTKWEQLFFPFPIAGAPPQLEQQVQLFVSVFHGERGGGVVPAVELAMIATPHLGFVASLPYQLGFGGQRFGFGDLQLSAQYLAGGSLRFDDMISIGLTTSVPTAQHDLGAGDWLFGPFVYAAQRLWHHLIFELDVTALIPILHGETARQLQIDGLVSTLVTPRRFRVPVYLQLEVDGAVYLDGSAGLPPAATSSPAATAFVAPELFIGPVRGVRVAGGCFFAVAGDPVHAITATLTVAVDIPNRFGY